MTSPLQNALESNHSYISSHQQIHKCLITAN